MRVRSMTRRPSRGSMGGWRSLLAVLDAQYHEALALGRYGQAVVEADERQTRRPPLGSGDCPRELERIRGAQGVDTEQPPRALADRVRGLYFLPGGGETLEPCASGPRRLRL